MQQLNFELSANIHSPAPSRERCMENPKGYNYTIDVFHDQAMAWMEDRGFDDRFDDCKFHLKERGFAEKHSIFGVFLMYVA